MRVKVILIDGTRHDIENCQDVFCPSTDPKYVVVRSGKSTYMFNMQFVKYIQKIEEEDDNG